MVPTKSRRVQSRRLLILARCFAGLPTTMWKLNEAFGAQVLPCIDRPSLGPAFGNFKGGAVSVGHRYGMTGMRCSKGAEAAPVKRWSPCA